jgi:hypothetical protein
VAAALVVTAATSTSAARYIGDTAYRLHVPPLSDGITTKYHRRHKQVAIVGLNDYSAEMHGRLAGNLGAGH